jgi:hypothetical protein
MLRIHQRIKRLESILCLSDRIPPFVHRINFVDSKGRVTGVMTLSSDPNLSVPYRAVGDDEVFEERREERADGLADRRQKESRLEAEKPATAGAGRARKGGSDATG